jgi:hypothetical protein
MSSKVSIFYNNADAFYPQPIPFISIEKDNIYYSEVWAAREIITLNGIVTGCTMDKIVDAQKSILNSFNKNFQTLQITESDDNGYSGIVFSRDNVEVNSISFPQNRWFGVMPYIISLSSYPSGMFSGVYGVLDPTDNWSYTEKENAEMEIVHTISCKGINTSNTDNNALNNSINWINQRTGNTAGLFPIMISGVSQNNFTLISQAENINRFDGSYSVIETYINDLARNGYGVVRYTTSVESGNNLLTVNLNGSVIGGQRNIIAARNVFTGLNILAIATNSYSNLFGEVDLNPIPLKQEIVEDSFNTKIDFSYIYDNSNYPQTYFDYSVDMDTSVNGLINANIQGTIYSRGTNLLDKLQRCINYSQSVNLYNLVLTFYNNFDTSSIVPLNKIPISSGQDVNYSEGNVSLRASFNNQIKESDILDRFNFVINFIPRVYRVDSQPKLDGYGSYSAINLGYANRSRISIQGNAVVNLSFASIDGKTAIKQICFMMLQKYGSMINVSLDKEDITTDRSDDRLINFSFEWSFDSSNIIGPSTVTNISV